MKGGGGSYPRFPSEFKGHGLGLQFWTFLREDFLGSVGQPVRKTAASSPRAVKQTLGHVRTKNWFGLEILKFKFSVCTSAYRAPVLLVFLRYIVRTDVGNRGVGRDWLLPVFFGLISYVMLS